MTKVARVQSHRRRRSRVNGLLCGLIALLAAAAPAAEGEEAVAPGAAELVVYALTLIDTPYRYGGSRPSSGFDCSGFVRYVVGEALGLDLPRRSEEMRRVGAVIARDAVAPGDLVFFNTLGRPWSHVAIAIGDGRFVHAPARGGRVRIENLSDAYWRARFNGARRLQPQQSQQAQPDQPAVVASAREGAETIEPEARITP